MIWTGNELMETETSFSFTDQPCPKAFLCSGGMGRDRLSWTAVTILSPTASQPWENRSGTSSEPRRWRRLAPETGRFRKSRFLPEEIPDAAPTGLTKFLCLPYPMAGSLWAIGRLRYAALDHAEAFKLALMGRWPGLGWLAPLGRGRGSVPGRRPRSSHNRQVPRTFYKVVGVVKHSFGNTSPPRAGSGVKGAPRSGAFIVDP